MMSEVNGRNDNSFNIHGGQLIVVAGRPGMGKSLFMLNQIKYLCGKKGEAALIISLDESKYKLVGRLMSLCGEVDSDSMHSGNLNDGDWESIINSANTILGWHLVLDDERTPLESICEKIRTMKKVENVSIVFIDFIQLVTCNREMKSRNEEMGYIVSKLKNLAVALDISIVVLSQLSRTCEKREDHHPVLMDIRETAIRSENADVVILLYREGYYRCDSSDGYGCNPMDAEVIVAKYPNMKEIPVTIHMKFSVENGWY